MGHIREYGVDQVGVRGHLEYLGVGVHRRCTHLLAFVVERACRQ